MYLRCWLENRTKLFLLFLSLMSGCSSPQTQPLTAIAQAPKLEQNSFIADDGYRLPLTTYWPVATPKGMVIALHGFNDYSNGFTEMCEYYATHDIACFAYDQRGFGKSAMRGLWPYDGRLQKDLQILVKLLAQQYSGLPIFLLGESMGGAVILTAMADTHLMLSEYVQGVLLYAPAVWARSTQPWYQTMSLWLAVHTFPDWQPTGKGLGIQATDNIDALRAMSRDKLVIKATRIDTLYGLTNLMDAALLAANEVSINSLVLYGEKDQVVPKKAICEMLNEMKNTPKHIVFKHYPKGYHMLSRDLQAARVFEDSRIWMFDLLLLNQQQNIGILASLQFEQLSTVMSIDYCD